MRPPILAVLGHELLFFVTEVKCKCGARGNELNEEILLINICHDNLRLGHHLLRSFFHCLFLECFFYFCHIRSRSGGTPLPVIHGWISGLSSPALTVGSSCTSFAVCSAPTRNMITPRSSPASPNGKGPATAIFPSCIILLRKALCCSITSTNPGAFGTARSWVRVG